MFGLDPKFFIGRTNWELPWPPESVPLVQANRRVLEARQPFRDVIIWGMNATGKRAAMRGSGRPVYDARGRFLGYRGTGSDVTAEVRAQQEAELTNRQLLNALDNFPGGFALFDPQERLMRWNGNLQLLFPAVGGKLQAGASMDQLVRAAVELYSGQAHERREQRAAELMRLIRSSQDTLELHTRDNRWLQVHGRKAVDGSTVVVIMEITRRQLSEEQTRRSEANLARAQQIAHLGSWEMDLKGTDQEHIVRGSLSWSDEVYRILGFQPRAFVPTRERFLETVHPADRDILQQALLAAVGDGVPYTVEHRIIRPDGTERVVQEQGELVRDPETKNPVRLLATIQDITDRKRTETQLQEHQALLEAVFDAIPHGVFVKNREGQFVTVNRAMAQHMGVPVSEFSGRTVWPPTTPDEERLAIEEYDRQVIATGQGMTMVEARTLPDGQKTLVRVIKQPILNAQGQITGIVGIAEDISERLAAERRKTELEGQLHQAQKMETIGRLAGGVAHDFNNLLTPILGHAQLALARLSPEHPLYGPLNAIHQAGVRAADLTRRLLAFSRKQVLDFRLTNLNDEVTTLGHMLKGVIGEDIEVAIALDPELGTTRADPSQVQQILMNLVVNARDAMPQGGKLTIKTSNTTLDSAYAREHKGVKPGDYVVLTVSDTGYGMDPATQAHIFEPFYTTKEQGKGTGLGLSIVEGIVGQHRGHISVQSESGHGTTFTIYLPRVSGTVAGADRAGAIAESLSGSETVL
ncbi:MAG TPA: PAS domain S-box protein, partial [bacterium]|nr:PAS domain S-box protein [bacterium]